MSLFNDVQFVLNISTRLENFKQKGDHLFNFRCPICGDSKRNQSKSRGYFFRYEDLIVYKCHNCGVSLSFDNFLKEFDSELHKRYLLEKLSKTDKSKLVKSVDEQQFREQFSSTDLENDLLTKISDLEESHIATQYLKKRKIPFRYFTKLYFTEDFKKYCNSLNLSVDIKSNDPRIVIPFMSFEKKYFAFQGRALDKNEIRYITMKLDKDALKIYGMDTINRRENVKVVEGPFDSMFIDNCIAAAGSDIQNVSRFVNDFTVVYDNEPRNSQIVEKNLNYIQQGYKVCIWPQTVQEKDINDMILAGKTSQEVEFLIEGNTVSGLQARIALNKWKRC